MNASSPNNVQVFGRGQRVLMFAHGFGTDQTSWRAVADSFAVDHRIVLFDHIGFGASDRLAFSAPRHLSLDGYALDVLAILDDLAFTDVVYIGHSIGGVLGLLATIAKRDRFEQLVLLNTSPHFIDEPPNYLGGFREADITGLLDLMDRDYAAWAEYLAPVAVGVGNDPSHIRRFGQALHSLDPMITRRFARLAFYVDCRAALARVKVPSLILQSTQDSFAPPAVGQYLHHHLSGSRLEELPSSGHCPHITQPDLVIGALRRHLASHQAN